MPLAPLGRVSRRNLQARMLACVWRPSPAFRTINADVPGKCQGGGGGMSKGICLELLDVTTACYAAEVLVRRVILACGTGTSRGAKSCEVTPGPWDDLPVPWAGPPIHSRCQKPQARSRLWSRQGCRLAPRCQEGHEHAACPSILVSSGHGTLALARFLRRLRRPSTKSAG